MCCGLGVRFSASAMATAWLCRPGAADMIATNDSNVPSWSQESPSMPAKVDSCGVMTTKNGREIGGKLAVL